MTNLFKILSDNFDDDMELANYIRMLGNVPDADLELPNGLQVGWKTSGIGLEELLDNVGLHNDRES
jgi:hypothetical protein